jgi:DNA-binding SARP family transcriptional activator
VVQERLKADADFATANAEEFGGARSADVDQTLLSAVFDSFPVGILVVDRSGIAIASNRALTESLRAPRPGVDTCCELFGCRKAGGPLADACLTEAALAAGGRLVPVRIERDSRTAAAVWVTAAPLDSARTRVVFEIRPADQPVGLHVYARPGATERLRVSALGPMRVEVGGRPLEAAWIDQRPGQLLKYLVVHRGRLSVTEQIADALWPASGQRAATTVRHFIHVLRSDLEPNRTNGTPSSFVVGHRGGYRLNPMTVDVDVDEFEAELNAGFVAFAEGQREVAEERLAKALELYRGEFLHDLPYADWAVGERERLREKTGKCLRALASLRLGARDLDGATAYLERLAEMEPFDADAQRDLIAICVRRGRYRRAARLYAAFERRLWERFHEPPGFALSDVGLHSALAPPS